jgi:phosphotransferase system  glucose/maltose/N-acetylglucosamine-specific IIC component
MEEEPKVAAAGSATPVEDFARLGRAAVIGLVLLGAVLVVAGLLMGLLWIVGIGVGLSEPRRPTGLESTLFAAWALFAFLLLGTGIASMRCRTRRRLRGVGALAAATAITLASCFILEPLADRSACEKSIVKQKEYGPGWQVDTSCRGKS